MISLWGIRPAVTQRLMTDMLRPLSLLFWLICLMRLADLYHKPWGDTWGETLILFIWTFVLLWRSVTSRFYTESAAPLSPCVPPQRGVENTCSQQRHVTLDPLCQCLGGSGWATQCVEQVRHGVVCGTISLVCKLKWVNGDRKWRSHVISYQSL